MKRLPKFTYRVKIKIQNADCVLLQITRPLKKFQRKLKLALGEQKKIIKFLKLSFCFFKVLFLKFYQIIFQQIQIIQILHVVALKQNWFTKRFLFF